MYLTNDTYVYTNHISNSFYPYSIVMLYLFAVSSASFSNWEMSLFPLDVDAIPLNPL